MKIPNKNAVKIPRYFPEQHIFNSSNGAKMIKRKPLSNVRDIFNPFDTGIIKEHPKRSAKILSPLQRLKPAIAIILCGLCVQYRV